MNEQEDKIWEGSTSQISNFAPFLVYAILMVVLLKLAHTFHPYFSFGIPILLLKGFWQFLVVANQKYTLTNERLFLYSGVLNKLSDEAELYRIKDFRVDQPFFLRIFSLGNVRLITSDQLNPIITIKAIENPQMVGDYFRKAVESRRVARGVREIDAN